MGEQKLLSFLYWLSKNIYVGRVKNTIQQIGLESFLEHTYLKVLKHGDQSDFKTITIGDVSAQFHAVYDREIRGLLEHYLSVGEGPVVIDILSQVRPGDVLYDVGANIGLYACLLAKKRQTGQVIAFEPHPQTAKRLEENLSLNHLQSRVFRYALSDSIGEMKLLINDDVPGAQGTLGKSDEMKDFITVSVTTADSLIEQGVIPAPDVIKIDVEGAEINVLRGMQQALDSDNCRLIYCEVHTGKLPQFGRTSAELSVLLKRHGFTISKIHERGPDHFVRAEK